MEDFNATPPEKKEQSLKKVKENPTISPETIITYEKYYDEFTKWRTNLQRNITESSMIDYFSYLYYDRDPPYAVSTLWSIKTALRDRILDKIQKTDGTPLDIEIDFKKLLKYLSGVQKNAAPKKKSSRLRISSITKFLATWIPKFMENSKNVS